MSHEKFALYADGSNLERAEAVLESATEFSVAQPEGGRDSVYETGLSVIILNRDRADLLLPLVEQLGEQGEAVRHAGVAFEIMIGDTGSTDPRVLAAYGDWRDEVVVVRNLSYHFSRCNNQVAQEASYDSLLFLNNDVILPPRREALLELHRALHRSPDIGILGAVLYFPDGKIQHSGIDFFRQPPYRGFPFHPHAREMLPPAELPAIFDSPATTGSLLLICRHLFESVGGFPEDYAAECQDIDLCLRVHRKGYKTQILNLGRTVHLENATRPKGEENWPDRRLFLRRWRSYVGAQFL